MIMLVAKSWFLSHRCAGYVWQTPLCSDALAQYTATQMTFYLSVYLYYLFVCIHWSDTTLKSLIGDMNNIDHLITMQCYAGKPWVLVFMWMPLDMHQPSEHLCTKYTPLITTTLAMAPRQDSVPWHTANTAQEQLEEQNKGPKVLTGTPISPDPNLKEHLEDLLNRSNPWRPHPKHTRPREFTIKGPGARHHRTHSEVLIPCLDRSELFWLHKGKLHNIRQVVIMLCLISVCVCITFVASI